MGPGLREFFGNFTHRMDSAADSGSLTDTYREVLVKDVHAKFTGKCFYQ